MAWTFFRAAVFAPPGIAESGGAAFGTLADLAADLVADLAADLAAGFGALGFVTLGFMRWGFCL
jgi:hypothetical protein